VKIHKCQQGSDEWFALRRGIPTGSSLNRIITAKGLKPSSQQEKYIDELVAEWFTGESSEGFDAAFASRGTAMEAEARKWYTFHSGLEVEQVGFISTLNGMFGVSPDGLVGLGGLEIKCPSAKVHVGNLRDEDDFVMQHRLQVQGNLWASEREWFDLVSYNPVMPPGLVRVGRDEKVIEAIKDAVEGFVDRLLDAREAISIRNASSI
jgi:exodeoxyribonuclease (lambda-induced)